MEGWAQTLAMAGAMFGVAAAVVCAIGALVTTWWEWQLGDDGAVGIGCALVALVWAAIAALLLWMARG